MINRFLRIFRLFEVDKAEVPGLLLFVKFNVDRLDFTKLFEHAAKLILSELVIWEVLHIQIGAARLLHCSNTVKFWHILAHSQLSFVTDVCFCNFEVVHFCDCLLSTFLTVKLHESILARVVLRVDGDFAAEDLAKLLESAG